MNAYVLYPNPTLAAAAPSGNGNLAGLMLIAALAVLVGMYPRRKE